MRKTIFLTLFFIVFVLPCSAFAILSMELTRGVAGAIPIAIVPFSVQGGEVRQDVCGIVTQDLQNSGRFKVVGRAALNPYLSSEAGKVSADYFRKIGTDNVVVGKINAIGGNRYQVSFQLLDLFRKGGGATSVVLAKKYTVSSNELRQAAHHISDLIYEQITGVRGIFSTRIAYIVVQRAADGPARYALEVSDQDGYGPRPLLNSTEPIMSPAWSPNGRYIAYVSFEKKQAGIFLQDIVTGNRRLLSEFPGINGAPAWSPDGKKLALVLSKSGSPNIYVMDVTSGTLSQITRDFYINTEPAWSPDGKSLIYTSNRSGGPQIYQINVRDGSTSRVTFDGDYNARASFARDGKSITMIHRVSGVYNIAILDLNTGRVRVLNGAIGDSTSPSLAPNGTMVLYDTVYSGRNVLAMVSSDGSVQVRLPAANGEAQDPSWSPFLG